MRSSVIWEVYSRFLQGQTKESKEALAAAAVQYYTANGKGQQQEIRAGYERMLAQVRQGERESGVRLIESPDESYVCALTALASAIYQTVTKTCTITFSSVEDADDWLYEQSGILVKNVEIQTCTTLGLFANHTQAKTITITYQPSGGDPSRVYGMCEVEKTQLFIHSDPEDFAEEWEEDNPECKCVFIRSCTNSRGSSGSQLFGLGFDYVEHIKHFIVFHEPVSQD